MLHLEALCWTSGENPNLNDVLNAHIGWLKFAACVPPHLTSRLWKGTKSRSSSCFRWSLSKWLQREVLGTCWCCTCFSILHIQWKIALTPSIPWCTNCCYQLDLMTISQNKLTWGFGNGLTCQSVTVLWNTRRKFIFDKINLIFSFFLTEFVTELSHLIFWQSISGRKSFAEIILNTGMSSSGSVDDDSIFRASSLLKVWFCS
jgi:hypothetical protein